jgi:hypothetical protein
LENLVVDDDVDMNGPWKSIRENMKMEATDRRGYYELKQYKPWFDEACSNILDQRRQAKLQWLQDPRHTKGDNLKYVTCETSRTFRNKEREYMKQTTRAKT